MRSDFWHDVADVQALQEAFLVDGFTDRTVCQDRLHRCLNRQVCELRQLFDLLHVREEELMRPRPDFVVLLGTHEAKHASIEVNYPILYVFARN